MKPQYQHQVVTSFAMWFDNYLLQKGEAYSNKTGRYYYMEDTRLSVGNDDNPMYRYSTAYKQFVTDSSITGSTNPIIPSGAFLSTSGSFQLRDKDSFIKIDFENGGLILTGLGPHEDTLTITGAFAVKDFNTYITNSSEEDLILESKFKQNSRYGSTGEIEGTGIEPYDKVVPAIFINNEFARNVPFAFGGEDETQTTLKCVVMAENEYQLDGVLSIFADSYNSSIQMVPFTGYPITELGDIKAGLPGGHGVGGSSAAASCVYNYTGLVNAYSSIEKKLYVNDVTVSKFSDRAQKTSLGGLKIGFIDFELHQHRFPRQ
jgi:hypothetical protein